GCPALAPHCRATDRRHSQSARQTISGLEDQFPGHAAGLAEPVATAVPAERYWVTAVTAGKAEPP
ncbi:hypothetical protein, partial [Mycobacterium marinum]|uniref:hypothetical protein n=1 Tax=Mycobacterium marinum TaxID=1781 RepID=UPI001CA5C731